MAIYSYTNSGITFNTINSAPNPKLSIPGKLVSNQNDFEYAAEDGIKPIINAVEIDWNDAQLGTSTINTTGELLSYISGVANNPDPLESAGLETFKFFFTPHKSIYEEENSDFGGIYFDKNLNPDGVAGDENYPSDGATKYLLMCDVTNVFTEYSTSSSNNSNHFLIGTIYSNRTEGHTAANMHGSGVLNIFAQIGAYPNDNTQQKIRKCNMYVTNSTNNNGDSGNKTIEPCIISLTKDGNVTYWLCLKQQFSSFMIKFIGSSCVYNDKKSWKFLVCDKNNNNSFEHAELGVLKELTAEDINTIDNTLNPSCNYVDGFGITTTKYFDGSNFHTILNSNNISNYTSSYITQSTLSEMGYTTSSNLANEIYSITDWVSSNYVEKPTNTGILAGVVTLQEKINLYDNDQVKSFIKQNVAANLHKYNWDYTNPFNLAYVSTNNKDVDGALYGTIKCTTNTSGYLYIITVDPVEAANDVMGDVLPSATFINQFSYISSNTLPSALDLIDMNSTGVSIFAYVRQDSNGTPPKVKGEIKYEDEWTPDTSYTIHANLLISETNLFIGEGTKLNIYTSFNYTAPTVPPTSPTTDGSTPPATDGATSPTTDDPTSPTTDGATSPTTEETT